LDFTAHQRTCKLAGAPWARIPWTIDSLASTGYIEHALLATFSEVFLDVCVCMYMCALRHDKEDPVKQGVCHTVALPFTLKSMLRQKKELWKLKYFTMQTYNLQKNPSIYYNYITNLKFQHKPKYHLSKILV
jgi:hypothetical protein